MNEKIIDHRDVYIFIKYFAKCMNLNLFILYTSQLYAVALSKANNCATEDTFMQDHWLIQ